MGKPPGVIFTAMSRYDGDHFAPFVLLRVLCG